MWSALSESVVSVVKDNVVSIVEEDGSRERERESVETVVTRVVN